MPQRRVRLDINDDEGNKIAISLEGNMSREKILQLLDLADLLGGTKTDNTRTEGSDLSKLDKIQNVLWRKFPIGWFTSQEVMVAYEDVFDEPIGLSTVSTYLSRLTGKGILMKTGPVAKRRYRLVKEVIKEGSRKSRYDITP